MPFWIRIYQLVSLKNRLYNFWEFFLNCPQGAHQHPQECLHIYNTGAPEAIKIAIKKRAQLKDACAKITVIKNDIFKEYLSICKDAYNITVRGGQKQQNQQKPNKNNSQD